mmetsp:Transcript_19501/g.60208  ORF Transcript_19501/g.60208 Transcript_19501/m.60208 type:complete len:223 (+) Transcript_19501:653-1321(+)
MGVEVSESWCSLEPTDEVVVGEAEVGVHFDAVVHGVPELGLHDVDGGVFGERDGEEAGVGLGQEVVGVPVGGVAGDVLDLEFLVEVALVGREAVARPDEAQERGAVGLVEGVQGLPEVVDVRIVGLHVVVVLGVLPQQLQVDGAVSAELALELAVRHHRQDRRRHHAPQAAPHRQEGRLVVLGDADTVIGVERFVQERFPDARRQIELHRDLAAQGDANELS